MIDFASASLFDKLVFVCGGGMLLLAVLVPLLRVASTTSQGNHTPQQIQPIKSIGQQIQARDERIREKQRVRDKEKRDRVRELKNAKIFDKPATDDEKRWMREG